MEVIHQYKVAEDSVTIYDEDGKTVLGIVRRDGFEVVSKGDKLSCQFKPQMASQVDIFRLLNAVFAAKIFIALHLFDIQESEFQQIIDIEELMNNELYRVHGYITRHTDACPDTAFFFHKDNPKTIFCLYNAIGDYHLHALKDGVLYKVEDRQDAEFFGNRHLHDIAEKILREEW